MSLREELERRRMAKNAGTTESPHNTNPGNAAPAQNEKSAERASALSATPPVTPPLFLRLVKANKQRWLFPWACFHGVSYEPNTATGNDTDTEKSEQLHFVFMRHNVTVRGRNLASVVYAIEETNLRELCEVVEKYQPVTDTDSSPAIAEIEVKAR